ncbi:MAG: hypothetical protein ABIZ36_14730 [Gemmatimonadaceae bacterium]
MKRLSAAIVVSAGIVTIAACTDASRVVDPSSNVDLAPSYTQTPDNAQEKHIAFVPTKQKADAERAARAKPGGGGTASAITVDRYFRQARK